MTNSNGVGCRFPFRRLLVKAQSHFFCTCMCCRTWALITNYFLSMSNAKLSSKALESSRLLVTHRTLASSRPKTCSIWSTSSSLCTVLYLQQQLCDTNVFIRHNIQMHCDIASAKKPSFFFSPSPSPSHLDSGTPLLSY